PVRVPVADGGQPAANCAHDRVPPHASQHDGSGIPGSRRSVNPVGCAVFLGTKRGHPQPRPITRECIAMSRKLEIPSPIALPRDTWGATLGRTVSGFRENKLNHWGAALTYYAVLSLFPALLVLVSFIGLVATPARVATILTDTVSQLGPKTAAKTFQGPIQSITANRGAAGVVFAVGIPAAL